jgi:23S rRNA (adenine2503-C2)-methyltransferase
MTTSSIASAGTASRSPDVSPNFYGLTREALSDRLVAAGQSAYRAVQIFGWVYQRRKRSSQGMSNLPAALRKGLEPVCDLSLPRVASLLGTRDGKTHKFVFELADGARVESVSMRSARGLTLCLSSQVGCALKCSFCATGLMGLRRNLGPDEIVAQVVGMGDATGWKDERFNLVFMGMGEPLANPEAVLRAVRILRDPHGLNLGARRITVSTSGIVPGIERLAEEGVPLGLAVSLHATTDELRDQLVPVNRRWPIRSLLGAARAYGERVGRRVTLEYTLLAGVNDGPDDAERLGRMARELPSKVNLIPYNPVPGLPYRRPTPESVTAFAESLYPHAPAVTVRKTLGGEIWAACGQLGGLGPESSG